MDLNAIIYSMKPPILGDRILCKRIVDDNADFIAIFGLISNRTNLTTDQIISLEDDEVQTILVNIAASITKAKILENIGKGLNIDA